VEKDEGQWDWSLYLTSANQLRESGLGYNVFCWLHFPPKWYEESDKFVPYVNMVTGQAIPQLSLWSPDLDRIYNQFYHALSVGMGDKIDFIRIALPSEYGEIGYCNGMTSWLRPQEHAGSGYWCGDPYAVADFKKAMRLKYREIERLNQSWGTNNSDFDVIEMPKPEISKQFATSAQARKRWLAFADWYQQAWVQCLGQIDSIVKIYFPNKEYIASLGYGAECLRLGNEQSRHIQAMSELNLACQSPGDIGYFATRRVSSACRHYNVRYYTEPPGGVPPERELNRIFMDISNGTQTWFDYLSNLENSIAYFQEYKKYLNGSPPRTNVAVWHPTSDLWLKPEHAWSEDAWKLSDPLREVLDYEIIDDRMIVTGALDSLGIRQLILAGADWLDRDAWLQVHSWVRNGGVLYVLKGKAICDVDGKDDLWKEQVPVTIPKLDKQKNPAAYFEQGKKTLGKGIVLTIDTEGTSQKDVARALEILCVNIGSMMDKPENNYCLIDHAGNGLLATRFDDKILYFNYTNENKVLDITYRQSDFANKLVPQNMTIQTEIPARMIYSVPLF
jgi:hypothetical protein